MGTDVKNLQACTLGNTSLGEYNWFWRKSKFSLVLKLIPNKYGHTVSEVAIERCS